MKSVVFRMKHGNLGFFQVDDDKVHFVVKGGNGVFDADGCGLWDTWCRYGDTAGTQLDNQDVTPATIEFFLRQSAVTGEGVAELYEVKYPGVYYPRMMRENLRFTHRGPSFLQDMRAYQNIQSSLDNLFNFIEPVEINLTTYGHKIRELLILACTEVEYLLLKTLTENGYQEKSRYSTWDYIKCRDVLKLNKYETKLIQYSDLKVFAPFKDWSNEKGKTTESIPWYDAYNRVKHNRNDNISHANLEHLLDAISAIHILLESQYGEGIFQSIFGQAEHKSLFSTLKRPIWELHQINAPILIDSYPLETEWIAMRKYFEDYPI